MPSIIIEEIVTNVELNIEEVLTTVNIEVSEMQMPGADGYTPIKGVDYFDGEQGIPGTTDHLLLENKGVNTHAEIDTALTRLANTSGDNTGDQDLSGYELLSNKKTDVETNKTSNTFYASVKAIVDWIVARFLPLTGGTLTGVLNGLSAVFTSTIQATRFISTVATGTAPITVASTTLVTNLNADLLDGLDSTAFTNTTLSKYITYGQSILDNHRSRVIADLGKSEPSNAAYELGRLKNQGLLRGAKVLMLPTNSKAGKLHSIKPIDGTGDFTVSRPVNTGFNATRINEDGLIENVGENVPRIDFSSGDGELLLEPQSINLITYSRSFDNAYWTKTGATVTGGFSSPHVQYPTSGFKMVESALNETHKILTLVTAFSVVAGSSYSFSFLAKKGENNFVNTQAGNYNELQINSWFDLNNGTSTNVKGTSTIKALADGWYLCTVSGTSTTTRTQAIVIIIAKSILTAPSSYLGDGTSGVYIAFAQFEQRASATSLMMPVTEGSTQQRNADVVTVTVPSAVTTVTENVGTPYAVTPATTYTVPGGRYTKITMQ